MEVLETFRDDKELLFHFDSAILASSVAFLSEISKN